MSSFYKSRWYPKFKNAVVKFDPYKQTVHESREAIFVFADFVQHSSNRRFTDFINLNNLPSVCKNHNPNILSTDSAGNCLIKSGHVDVYGFINVKALRVEKKELK